MKFQNKFKFQLLTPKPGKLGSKDLNDYVITDWEQPNITADVGIEALLDAFFLEGDQTGVEFFIGLVNNAAFTGFSAAHTMASHATWAEFVNYSESTRPQWLPSAADDRAVVNDADTVDFSINDTGVLRGVFVCTDEVKTGTDGILWAMVEFDTTKAVSNGSILRLTYTVSA